MEDKNNYNKENIDNNLKDNEEKKEIETNKTTEEVKDEIKSEIKSEVKIKEEDIDNLYELKESNEKDSRDYKSLLTPIFKILITFAITLIIISLTSNFTSKRVIKNNLKGLWGDEHGNYYEISDERFSMNIGNPDLSFFDGEIDNIILMDNGYKLFISGKKYIINNNEKIFDKNMELILEIKDYTSELKTVMVANLGTDDYQIIRLEESIKQETTEK